jgi:hypothetical protein
MKTGFLAVLGALALVTTGFSGGWNGHGGWHGGYRGGYQWGWILRAPLLPLGILPLAWGLALFAGGYNPWWLLPIPVPYPYYGDMVPATVMDMDRVTATGIKKI